MEGAALDRGDALEQALLLAAHTSDVLLRSDLLLPDAPIRTGMATCNRAAAIAPVKLVKLRGCLPQLIDCEQWGQEKFADEQGAGKFGRTVSAIGQPIIIPLVAAIKLKMQVQWHDRPQTIDLGATVVKWSVEKAT